MLSSGSTEMETDLAPAMSASTPAMVPPETVAITPVQAESSTSVMGSPTLMSQLKPLLTPSRKAMNTSGDA